MEQTVLFPALAPAAFLALVWEQAVLLLARAAAALLGVAIEVRKDAPRPMATVNHNYSNNSDHTHSYSHWGWRYPYGVCIYCDNSASSCCYYTYSFKNRRRVLVCDEYWARPAVSIHMLCFDCADRFDGGGMASKRTGRRFDGCMRLRHFLLDGKIQ